MLDILRGLAQGMNANNVAMEIITGMVNFATDFPATPAQRQAIAFGIYSLARYSGRGVG
jgi:hypothetical protein